MNNPFDHIEEFLAGELSVKEHAQFERALLKDANLRDEVEMVREMDMFAQRKADSKGAIDVVRQVMEDGEKIEEGKLRRLSFIRATAAVVLICLAAIGSWLYFSQGAEVLGHEELFAAYFDEPKMAIVKKGGDQDSILQIVQGLFNDKQYDKSIKEFRNLTPTDELSLYRAINYLLINKPDSSLVILQTTDNSTSDTEWYKAMSYLQMGDIEKTKEALHKIRISSIHYTKSQDLLKQL